MNQLAQDARWRHTLGARWFAGKGRAGIPVALTPLRWYHEPSGATPGVRSEILTVGYPDASREYYQLVVSYRDEPFAPALIGPAGGGLGWVHDATKDPEAIPVLLAALAEHGAGPQASGSRHPDLQWTAHLLRPEVFAEPLPARPFGGEQSNSSVFVGDTAVVKFFRRLEAGRNIDIELHEALVNRGVTDVDALYGWVDADLPSQIAGAGARADLLMVSEQLAVRAEGWPLATASSSAGNDFTAQAEGLGAALARVHAALSTALPTGEVDGSSMAATMTTRLNRAVAEVPALGAHRSQITDVFDRLRGRRLPTQRIHGDFHLGQTLLTDSGWKIIDLEGEPMKSLAERTRPDSVWRDVAGMLRSFGYANAVGGGTKRWQRDSCAGFMAGYQGLAPTAPDTDTLTAYVVDKAVYEVVYETHNRPDWVHIPMQAVVDILGP